MFGGVGDYFGDGQFGDAPWGTNTVYNSLPLLHRSLDAENDYPLRSLFEAFQNQLDAIRENITDLPIQRDPILCRAVEAPSEFVILLIANTVPPTQAGLVVQCASDVDYETGQTVSFYGFNIGDPAPVGSYEVIETSRDVGSLLSSEQFVIDAPALTTMVIGAADVGPRCVLKSKAAVPVEIWNDLANTDGSGGGTPSITTVFAGATAYTDAYEHVRRDVAMVEFLVQDGVDLENLGVGYTAELSISPGGPSSVSYEDPDVYAFTVLRITRRNSPEEPAKILCAGSSWPTEQVWWGWNRMTLLFKRPGVMGPLTSDFGILYDANEPVEFQRSGVSNVVQFVEKKSSERGYQIRAEAAGFHAQAQGLYYVSDPTLLGGLVESHMFVIPDEDGVDRTYTDISTAGQFRYDDIACDVVGIDYGDGDSEFPIVDAWIYPDDSPDGLSPLSSFSLCVTDEFTISVVRPATGAELTAADIPYGRVMVGVMPVAERDKIGQFTQSMFALRGVVTAEEDDDYPDLWVEEELSYDAGTGVIEFLIGIPDHFDDPDLGSYCIHYKPLETDVADSCYYCKSHVIRIELMPSAALLATGISGSAINDSVRRIRKRIKQEQVPIHVRIGEVALRYDVDIDAGFDPSVTGVDISIRNEISVFRTVLYDVEPADETDTDDANEIHIDVEVT
jgi:hypothetical protein